MVLDYVKDRDVDCQTRFFIISEDQFLGQSGQPATGEL